VQFGCQAVALRFGFAQAPSLLLDYRQTRGAVRFTRFQVPAQLVQFGCQALALGFDFPLDGL
jgi:hypothetical protein